MLACLSMLISNVVHDNTWDQHCIMFSVIFFEFVYWLSVVDTVVERALVFY